MSNRRAVSVSRLLCEEQAIRKVKMSGEEFERQRQRVLDVLSKVRSSGEGDERREGVKHIARSHKKYTLAQQQRDRAGSGAACQTKRFECWKEPEECSEGIHSSGEYSSYTMQAAVRDKQQAGKLHLQALQAVEENDHNAAILCCRKGLQLCGAVTKWLEVCGDSFHHSELKQQMLLIEHRLCTLLEGCEEHKAILVRRWEQREVKHKRVAQQQALKEAHKKWETDVDCDWVQEHQLRWEQHVRAGAGSVAYHEDVQDLLNDEPMTVSMVEVTQRGKRDFEELVSQVLEQQELGLEQQELGDLHFERLVQELQDSRSM